MDTSKQGSRSRSRSSSGSNSGSKGTRKNARSHSRSQKSKTNTTQHLTIAKKERNQSEDDDFEVVGHTPLIVKSLHRKKIPIIRPRELVSSKIKIYRNDWKITHEYSDGTKEFEIIKIETDKPGRVIFTKSKQVNSSSGWPGTKITRYFSDGRIEEPKNWKHGKETR